MDLNQVNSVQDLLSQNSTPEMSVVDKVKHLLVEEGNGKDNLPVIMWCLENLIRQHHEVCETLMSDEFDECPTEVLSSWVFDKSTLISAAQLLSGVNMDF